MMMGEAQVVIDDALIAVNSRASFDVGGDWQQELTVMIVVTDSDGGGNNGGGGG